jgi:subtilisin family serine protease
MSGFMNTYVVAGMLPMQQVVAQSISQNMTDNAVNIENDDLSKGPIDIVQKTSRINNTEVTKLGETLHNSFMVVLKIPEVDEKSFNSKQGDILNKTIRNLTTEIKKSGGQVTEVFKELGILHVKFGNLGINSTNITDQSGERKFRQLLEANPAIESVSNDTIVFAEAQAMPTGINRIDADRGPAKSGDGTGTIDANIAILDTGVQADHPDLNVVVCISFVGNIIPNFPIGGCSDNWDHGTRVAGIAAALDNDFGVVGVAPGASIYAMKVIGDNGVGRSSDTIEGLNFVSRLHEIIDVVNLSLSSNPILLESKYSWS